MRPTLVRSSVFLLLVAVAGCQAGGPGNPIDPGDPGDSRPMVEDETGRLRIDTPMPGAVLGHRTVLVEGLAEVSGATEVRVNGAPAPISGGRFSASIELEEGPTRIVVTALALEASVEVWVDATAPRIIVESPEPASFIDGSQLRVRGRVEDIALTGFTVDGEDVPVTGEGRFEFARNVEPGVARLRLRAEDRAGHVSYAYTSALVGRFRPAGDMVSEAMSFGIGPDALAEVSTGATALASSIDVEPYVLAENPAVSGWWGEINVESVGYSRVTIGLEPADGGIEVTAVLDGVHVVVGGTLSGTLDADRAVLSGWITLGTSGGRILAELVDPWVVLEGFRLDFAWVPWFIEDLAVVRDAVRTRIESALVSSVNEVVPPYIENALSSIPQGGAFTIHDVPLELSASVASLEVDRHGIRGSLDAGLRTGMVDLERTRGIPGSLDLDGTSAPMPDASGIGAAVSFDIVNAALYAAWSWGALELRFDRPELDRGPLTLAQLGLFAPELLRLAPPDSPVSFVVTPELPGVVVPTTGGGVEVAFGDVTLEVVANTREGDVHLVTISLALRAPVFPRVTDGVLSVHIGEVEVIGDAPGAPAGFPAGTELDSLLARALGPVLGMFTDIGGLVVPSLYGFHVDAPLLAVEGSYVTFAGTLRYTP
jgi:hypothetical protein